MHKTIFSIQRKGFADFAGSVGGIAHQFGHIGALEISARTIPGPPAHQAGWRHGATGNRFDRQRGRLASRRSIGIADFHSVFAPIGHLHIGQGEGGGRRLSPTVGHRATTGNERCGPSPPRKRDILSIKTVWLSGCPTMTGGSASSISPRRERINCIHFHSVRARL